MPFLLLTLASCAPHGPAAPQSPLPAMLAGLSAGTPRDCVPSRGSEPIRLTDDHTAVLRDGRTLWVNHLRAPCDAGDGFRTIVMEVHGGQYCRNDHFTLVDTTTAIPGPACFLGEWIPYTRS